MNALTSVGAGRARRQKNRGVEYLVGTPQLLDLALERFEALALGVGEQLRPPAGVGLGLAHPPAQGLVVDAEISRYVRDRAAGLKDEANGSLAELVGVLLRGWHSRRFSSPEDGTSSFRGESRDG